MLPEYCKFAVIISKIPVMQSGLKSIMQMNFPDYELNFCLSLEQLTLLQLRRTDVVIVDFSGDIGNPRSLYEQYYTLLSQYRDIHWIFMISRQHYALAVEFLMRPESTLLSDSESVERVIKAIQQGSVYAGGVSESLLILSQDDADIEDDSNRLAMLTLSERKVLRLLAKGWGINQIATLLKKSNKTVSAQKNSAMRRLSLRSNAEMYAWLNSNQGMKELNLYSAYGEQIEWKSAPGSSALLS
ncbi:helix-turn-helix transcriptional regulator [Kluyvera ascorbata]|jgi:Response regulator containing a CheY-like receiver domain and an HTH DNA-binding domain|uniref:Response regulator transcription factor n=1 Tax=Kluyvera ascorbata TaxID=51288 RepID=A0AB35XC03_9ENTR|nr:response regulator transcription factor [Kluyvera ascorbata]BBV67756.1 helix-turn-helix transcriptional regulator [Klebsiella sp. STW0522-44]HEB4874259.1 response regulator transcription factor [Kluyvera ascorbata F0526]MDT8702939.1 response regulator transcription factor [Kluyvera ascorbata]MDZ4033779.1 response regulator transcription factor [Kluyvera ascorbata]UPQ71113.1 response regulator transcription factor [Kluyvera ascorbata]